MVPWDGVTCPLGRRQRRAPPGGGPAGWPGTPPRRSPGSRGIARAAAEPRIWRWEESLPRNLTSSR
jgi:hypothetical protein